MSCGSANRAELLNYMNVNVNECIKVMNVSVFRISAYHRNHHVIQWEYKQFMNILCTCYITLMLYHSSLYKGIPDNSVRYNFVKYNCYFKHPTVQMQSLFTVNELN